MTDRAGMSEPWLRRLRAASTPLFAVAYAGAALLGRATVLEDQKLSLVWPAAGVAVLWLLHTTAPRLVVTAIAVGLGLVLSVTGASVPLVVMGALSAAVQAAVIVCLLRRWTPGVLGAGGDASIHSVGVLVRGAAAVAVGCVGGALLGLAGVGLDTGAVEAQVAALWFGRQFAGVMLVACVGHLTWEWLRSPPPATAATIWGGELVALWSLSLVAYLSVFLLPLPLTFAALPLTVWCASRFSTYAAAVHAAAFGTLAIVLTLTGSGPFSTLSSTAVSALVTQAFVLVTLLTALAVGSVRDQRAELMRRVEAAESDAASRAELLTAMTEAMAEGLLVLDGDGQVTRVNGAVHRLLEMTAVPALGHADDHTVLRADGSPMPPDERPSHRVLTEGDVGPLDLVVPLADGGRRVLSVTGRALSRERGHDSGGAALLVYRDVTEERDQANRLASFAEHAAHDLRSPLTALRGWMALALEELDDQPGVAPEARSALVRATASCERLDGLIEGLLEQAVAEGGDLQLGPLELSGRDGLVAEVAELLGMTHSVTVSGQIPAVLGDDRSVRQVLANLMGNAAKYAAPGRPVHVDVSHVAQGSRVFIRVTDNGRGVPADQREAIFERFNRGSGDRPVEVGSGIGLAICRFVVERHGGHIACAAGPDGVGTTFSFDLPRAVALQTSG